MYTYICMQMQRCIGVSSSPTVTQSSNLLVQAEEPHNKSGLRRLMNSLRGLRTCLAAGRMSRRFADWLKVPW